MHHRGDHVGTSGCSCVIEPADFLAKGLAGRNAGMTVNGRSGCSGVVVHATSTIFTVGKPKVFY